jgi:hypothetical protein
MLFGLSGGRRHACYSLTIPLHPVAPVTGVKILSNLCHGLRAYQKVEFYPEKFSLPGCGRRPSDQLGHFWDELP